MFHGNESGKAFFLLKNKQKLLRARMCVCVCVCVIHRIVNKKNVQNQMVIFRERSNFHQNASDFVAETNLHQSVIIYIKLLFT